MKADTEMKKNTVKQFKKARAFVSKEQCRIELSLPSNIGKKSGKLVTIFLGEENTLFNLIDIHSTQIPEYIANPVKRAKELKINYCTLLRSEERREIEDQGGAGIGLLERLLHFAEGVGQAGRRRDDQIRRVEGKSEEQKGCEQSGMDGKAFHEDLLITGCEVFPVIRESLF